MENRIKELKQKLDKIWEEANGNIKKIKESFTELIKEETNKYNLQPYVIVSPYVLENINYDMCERILKERWLQYLDSEEAFYYNEEEDFSYQEAEETLGDIVLEFDAFDSSPSSNYASCEFGPIGDAWDEYSLVDWATIFKLLKKEVEIGRHYLDGVNEKAEEKAQFTYQLLDFYNHCVEKFKEVTKSTNIYCSNENEIKELKIEPDFFYLEYKDRKNYGINDYKLGSIYRSPQNGVITYEQMWKIVDVLEDFYIFFNLIGEYIDIKIGKEFIEKIKKFLEEGKKKLCED